MNDFLTGHAAILPEGVGWAENAERRNAEILKSENFERRKRGKADKNVGMINADVDLAGYGGGNEGGAVAASLTGKFEMKSLEKGL